jgi:four helix bundle protein
VLSVYHLTRAFPKSELYALTSQIQRAAVSIPANIAEGCGRGGDPDFARFLQISMGSACELEYHILLAKDLELIDEQSYTPLQNEITGIKRMLTSLIHRLRTKSES